MLGKEALNIKKFQMTKDITPLNYVEFKKLSYKLNYLRDFNYDKIKSIIKKNNHLT